VTEIAILFAVLNDWHVANYAAAVEIKDIFPVNAVAVRHGPSCLRPHSQLKIVAEAILAIVVAIAVPFERIKLTTIMESAADVGNSVTTSAVQECKPGAF
jgi:hypothetical protein